MYEKLYKLSQDFKKSTSSIYRLAPKLDPEEEIIEETINLKDLFLEALKFEKIYQITPMRSLYTLISRTGRENYPFLIKTINLLKEIPQFKITIKPLINLLDYAISFPEEIWDLRQI